MTGTVEAAGDRVDLACANVRMTIARAVGGQHARGVGDRLAAAELELVGAEHDRQRAEPVHRRLDRDARAGRRLGEVARDRLAAQGRRARPPGRRFIAAARSSSSLELAGAGGRRCGAGAPRGRCRGWSCEVSAFDRAGHAAGAAATATELEAGDRDHLDPLAAQPRVGVDVALVGDDDARRDGEDVVAVVPLLALGLVAVAAGLEQPQRRDVERPGDRGEQVVLALGARRREPAAAASSRRATGGRPGRS